MPSKGESLLSRSTPHDPESGHELPRSFLPNAFEYNFRGLGSSEEYLRALHEHYGDKVISIRRLSHDRVQLGFAPDVCLAEVSAQGFAFRHTMVPMYRTYMPNENILCITVTNLSVNGPDKTTRALKHHFQQYGPIADIRLHYLGSTNWLLPSAAVYIDITNNPKLADKIDRCPIILGQRATLRWRNAPPLCGYCKLTGHAISACSVLRKKTAKLAPSKKTCQSKKRQRTHSPNPTEDRIATTAKPANDSPAPVKVAANSKAPEAVPAAPAAQPSIQSAQAAHQTTKKPILLPYKPLSETTAKASTSKSAPSKQTSAPASNKPPRQQGMMTRSKKKNMMAALWEGAYDESLAREAENHHSSDGMEGLDDEDLVNFLFDEVGHD